jgi:hypothetical protein
MRRTLMLDEDDLIMVVKEDVVKQIDENRGELNRTEFVNYLIQCQLRDFTEEKEYVSKEELRQFKQEMMELLHNFLQFFVSFGMTLGRNRSGEDIQALMQGLDPLDKPTEEEGNN